MRRRDLITLFGSTAISRPSLVSAQQPANMPTIGWLVFEAGEGGLDGFRQVGYVEGQNIAIEARAPEGSGDRLAQQVEELARLKVKVIVTGGVPATIAAKRAAQFAHGSIASAGLAALQLGTIALELSSDEETWGDDFETTEAAQAYRVS
jgi:putative ABC transport system substrate-binding protein